MMRKLLHILFFVAVFTLISECAFAGAWSKPNFSATPGGEHIGKLVTKIETITMKIHEASTKMMRYGDMIICASLYGKAAEIDLILFKIQVVDLTLFIVGGIFYILGFFIMMIASFYMFDVAFNLIVTIILLPIALSLWLFSWTKDKLATVMQNIAYYTGLFIFLPLGILIGCKIVTVVIDDALSSNLESYFDRDRSEELEELLGLISLPFLKILLSYVLAIKIIPLMADDFCTHFFGKALAGNPMKENVAQIAQMVKKHTLDKVAKYAGDVIKHQTGTAIKNAGEKMGGENPGLLSRAISSYGANMAQTKKQ